MVRNEGGYVAVMIELDVSYRGEMWAMGGS